VRFTARVIGSIEQGLRQEMRRIERAAPEGVRAAGKGLQDELRGQVTGAGLGPKLARTWRHRAYPNRGHDAAALVYSKAPTIIRAHGEGATIRPNASRWLAIPTDAAPKRGTGGKRVTPALVQQMYGRPLRYVRRRGRNPVLVMDGLVARGGKQGGFRSASVRRTKRRGAHVSLSGLTSVAMFVLVRQVRLRKRFDVPRAAERWSAKVPELMRQAIARQQ
jgi:hypothetical protein